MNGPAAMPADPDPVSADGSLAPDPAPVPRPVHEGEPAARVRADSEAGIGVTKFQERRQEPVDEPCPPSPEGPRAFRPEPERNVAEGGGDLVDGRAFRRRGAWRPVRRLTADEVPQGCHPRESIGRRRAGRHRDTVVQEVRAGVGRIEKMVVVRSIGQRAGVVVAARPVTRVCHDEQIVGRAVLPCRNMRHVT